QHPRVNILHPGPGVGGHCIAVDPWFLVSQSPNETRLIRTAREVNDAKPDRVFEAVKTKAGKFRYPVIGCLGLSYKADVDDMRESPALKIVRRLKEEGIGELLVCEPNLKRSPEFPLLPLDDVVERSDIVLLLVDHRQFKKLKAADLNEKVVIDT